MPPTEETKMGIFKMTLAGRKDPVLVKAAGVREAKDRVITSCESLNADEMEAALTNGETVWREGDDFPADGIEEQETAAGDPAESGD
jgi:hypothetical protein